MRLPPFIESVRRGDESSDFDLIFITSRFPLSFVRIVVYVVAPWYPLCWDKKILLIRSQAIDTSAKPHTIVGTMSNIKPLSDRVFLEAMEEDRMTKSGIVLPDSAEKERPIKGRVYAVGAGKRNDRGDIMHVSVKVGDIVLFKKYGPDEIELEGKKYLVAEESDILAILEN